MATGSVAEAWVTVRPEMDRFGPELKTGLGTVAKAGAAAFAVVGAAITGAAVAGLREFAKFESGMNEVFTLLPGISERAMGDMSRDVRDFSVEMGTATDEVVPALYQALSAGVPQGNVFDFLETANQAAIGGITDLETAVDGITSVVNAYGDDVVSAAEASDIMFTAVRLGKTDFEQLSSSLFNVIPTAAGLGVKFEDVSAALAEMTAQGVPTSVATTQLRQLFVELSREGGAAADMFQELSGKTFQEFIAEGGNTAQALELMRDGAAESGSTLQDMFGSVEAGAAALALSQGDFEGFQEAIDEMAGSAGATEAAYETMDAGISRALERIGAAWDEVKVIIGEALAPTLQGLADWVVENIPAIRQYFQDLMDRAVEMGRSLRDWWYQDAKPAVDEFIATVQENWPTVQEIFARLGEVVGDIASIFRQDMEAMSGDTKAGSSSMTDDVGEIVDGLNDFMTAVSETTGFIEENWDRISWVSDLMGGRVTMALDKLTGGGFTRFIERAAGMAVDGAAAVIRMGVDIRAALDRIGEKITGVIGWFAGLPGRIRGAIGNVGGLLSGIGRAIIESLWNGLRDRWDAVAGWVGGLGQRIQNLKGPMEVDRVLLTEQGDAIIGGLFEGMAKSWSANSPWLTDLTRSGIPGAVGGLGRPAAALDGGGRHYHLHLSTGRSEATVQEQFHRMELLHG